MSSIASLSPQQRNFRPLPNSTTGNESLVDMIGRKNIAQALIGVLGVGVVAATAAGFVAGHALGGTGALMASTLAACGVALIVGDKCDMPAVKGVGKVFGAIFGAGCVPFSTACGGAVGGLGGGLASLAVSGIIVGALALELC